ncbi:hypothetical protein C8N38_101531 [Rhodovulum kholense]|uniref:Uncharacterized protein n=1 Tax=Rhodovulum kholense TaxID=453584 RepID=A0A8E2VN98_9RHOB|nr:hypothetical protein C8N38_101531 [Rhodovulum kholense]
MYALAFHRVPEPACGFRSARSPVSAASGAWLRHIRSRRRPAARLFSPMSPEGNRSSGSPPAGQPPRAASCAPHDAGAASRVATGRALVTACLRPPRAARLSQRQAIRPPPVDAVTGPVQDCVGAGGLVDDAAPGPGRQLADDDGDAVAVPDDPHEVAPRGPAVGRSGPISGSGRPGRRNSRGMRPPPGSARVLQKGAARGGAGRSSRSDRRPAPGRLADFAAEDSFAPILREVAAIPTPPAIRSAAGRVDRNRKLPDHPTRRLTIARHVQPPRSHADILPRPVFHWTMGALHRFRCSTRSRRRSPQSEKEAGPACCRISGRAGRIAVAGSASAGWIQNGTAAFAELPRRYGRDRIVADAADAQDRTAPEGEEWRPVTAPSGSERWNGRPVRPSEGSARNARAQVPVHWRLGPDTGTGSDLHLAFAASLR